MKASSFNPIVSVGMPVYNGEGHLRDAVDSILAQTFGSFELIISDNASTDSTQAICNSYASRDQRIRYIRQPLNMGAPRNYSFLLGPARGRYFKWAAANDTCEPSMLEQCVAVLDRDPRVVLCFGRTRLIDGNGATIEIYGRDAAIRGQRPRDRFRLVHQSLALNNAQNGVIRTDALRRTRLVQPYSGSDLIMMAALALQGEFELVPDVLLNRRMTDETFSGWRSKSELESFLDPRSSGRSRPDSLLRHYDQFSSIFAARVGWREKVSVLATATRQVIWDRRRIASDLWSWSRS